MQINQHKGITHIDEGALDYLCARFNIMSMIDIGCGVGGQVDIARAKGIFSDGVDGDPAVNSSREPGDLYIHDFETGKFKCGTYDLAWCVELLEHIHEEFLPNVLAVLKRCSIVAVTAATSDWPSPYHVNCQPTTYWIEAIESVGFDYHPDESKHMQAASTMKREMMRVRGMLFTNKSRSLV